jgi:hypothetical protein
VLVALSFLLYFDVRANVIDRPDLALGNAHHVIDLERALGIFHEPVWQDWVLDYRLLVRFFNFVYFWLDFPLIALIGMVMYAFRRRDYTFTRDAILFSGLCALFSYALFPVAPPRLVPDLGVLDTLQAFSNLSYQAQSTSFFVNPYAAVPSLHVGWAFLLAIGVSRAAGWRWWVVALVFLHPLTQWASTILTGNHFILDGVAGLVAAALGVLYALMMQRWGYARLSRLLGLS